MTPRRHLIALVIALAVAGCGNERTPVPEVAGPGERLGDNPLDDARGGYKLIAPAGWTVAAGEAPLVSTISSGPVIVSIFRYPRTEPLPRTKDELDRATTDLLAAAKARDATFTPLKTARYRVDGRPGIQVRGTESVAGLPRTVRSTHVYAYDGELVIDMLAPSDEFAAVDKLYFLPMLQSIRLRKPTA
jgi:hypothetical protein